LYKKLNSLPTRKQQTWRSW